MGVQVSLLSKPCAVCVCHPKRVDRTKPSRVVLCKSEMDAVCEWRSQLCRFCAAATHDVATRAPNSSESTLQVIEVNETKDVTINLRVVNCDVTKFEGTNQPCVS